VPLVFFFFFAALPSSLVLCMADSLSSVAEVVVINGDETGFAFGGLTGGFGLSKRSLSGAVNGTFRESNARRALLATSSFSLVS
jgi:hypothetical protein